MEINRPNTDFFSLVDFPILDGAEAARWDKYSIHEKNVDSRLLMGWAGYCVFLGISREPWFGDAKQVHILAGTGNNGGDGYVLAWHIISSTSKKIVFWQLDSPGSNEAKYFFELCNAPELKNRIDIRTINDIHQNESLFKEGDIVADAVFGTGLNKAPSQALQNIFCLVNQMNHVVKIALDIPSGIYSNGDFYNHAVFKADFTYSFGSYKIGHLIEPGILSCGNLTVLPVGFFPFDSIKDRQIIFQNQSSNRRTMKSYRSESLRKPGGHKYDSGVLSILGGSDSMEGAALMAAGAFLSLGGGLARIFSPSPSMKQGLSENPGLMIQGDGVIAALQTSFLDSLKKSAVAVIGVGLKENLSRDFWERLLILPETNVIIDGSGLGQLIAHEDLFKNHRLKNLILTPHKAEAERLLGNAGYEKSQTINNIRGAALEISRRYNAHVYLKGPGGILVLKNDAVNKSLSDVPEEFVEIYLNSKHYELSTGGTGDVLCGVIANMLCRFDLVDSAAAIETALNVYFTAGEIVVNENFNKKDFLTPVELIQALRSSFNFLD